MLNILARFIEVIQKVISLFRKEIVRHIPSVFPSVFLFVFFAILFYLTFTVNKDIVIFDIVTFAQESTIS